MKYVIGVLIILVSILPCRADDFFIIGNKEGDAEILYPSQVQEGPDGNIYIYDERLAVIKVFSPQGDFLRKIGRKGQGPGEFQRTDGVSFNFTLDRKLLYFTEFFGGHRWITFMELSGKLHDVLKLKMEKDYGISSSVHLKDGSFLAKVSYNPVSKAQGDYFLQCYPLVLVKISPTGDLVSEILKREDFDRISFFNSGRDAPIPFTPLFRWVPLKNNSFVFTEGLKPVFEIYDLNGKIIGEIKTPLPEPQPVTGADLEKWREEYKNLVRDKEWFNSFGKVIYKYRESIYKKKANLDGLSSTPGGNLLVEGLANRPSKSKPYWLIDLKGNILKSIEIPGPISGIDISEHFIFAWASDEDDNPLIVCLIRKGTEAEDLVRIANYRR